MTTDKPVQGPTLLAHASRNAQTEAVAWRA
jgi:hypothetical protein